MGKKFSFDSTLRHSTMSHTPRLPMPGRWTVATCLLVLCCKHSAHSAIVRGDIDYQLYRDFGENKGAFRPGATNIPIQTRDGLILGWLDQAPMPDFSSVEMFATATLIAPQHIVGVAHNDETALSLLHFGGSGSNPYYGRPLYEIVRRNNHPTTDFHVPRLDKLVVDAEPAIMSNLAGSRVYRDPARFPAFYRTGSGTQFIQMPGLAPIEISRPYRYLTGGTVGYPIHEDDTLFDVDNINIFLGTNGLLPNMSETGDSGSPLFAWDTERQAWVLIATLATKNEFGNQWELMIPDFVEQSLAHSQGAQIRLDTPDTILRWGRQADTDTYRIVREGEHAQAWDTALAKGEDRDAGKNIRFSGAAGVLILGEDIDQGAGTLTFDSNFEVRPQDSQTWKGGGLSIAEGVSVDWQVNGVEDDSLHKAGKGTLRVNGVGSNAGNLKVGDGTVILAQRPDASGRIKAFDWITLISGRPTVVRPTARR